MYIARPDASFGPEEWRPFVEAQGFGHLVAPGRDRPVPAVVPTQFVLAGDEVLLHLAAPNPVLSAVAENPSVLLSVAGDWAYIPSDWKAIDGEDPGLGIPTTYYGAVQLVGRAALVAEPAVVAAILRRQLAATQPGTVVADPLDAHAAKLRSIRGIRIVVDDVRAKFKYGGNVDAAHRDKVVKRLRERDGPGDRAAADHADRRGTAFNSGTAPI